MRNEKTLVPPSKMIRQKLLQIKSENLNYVTEWLKNHEAFSAQETENAKRDFLKFAVLCYFFDKYSFLGPLVPSENADTFWHAFLLFNNKYSKWCDRHFGKTLNHFPGQAIDRGWEDTQYAINHYYNETWKTPGTSSASFLEEIDDFTKGWPIHCYLTNR